MSGGPWRRLQGWLGLAAALLLGGPVGAASAIRPDADLRFIGASGQVLAEAVVEIARTPAAIQRGLMFRELQFEDEGMLFTYPDSAMRVFWMRNTPSSLDMIFVDADRRVLNVASGTKPMSDTRYFSVAPARYVVEVPAGFAARHGIGPGTGIEWTERTDPDAKIEVDLSGLDAQGRRGPADGLRLLHYELCVPRTDQALQAARAIDPSLEPYSASPGRIGCTGEEMLVIGHTGLPDPEGRLLGLARLPFVRRIVETHFE